jgi:hypothetical protein
MTEKIPVIQNAHEDKITVRRVAAGVGATAAAIVLAAGTANLANRSDETHRSNEAHNIEEASSFTYVLHKDVNVRKSPERVEDAASGVSNLKFTIPSGKELKVTLPVISQDRPGWIGFHDPSDHSDKVGNTVWVNLEAAKREDLVDIIPYGKSDTVPVAIKDGQYTEPGNPRMEIAQSDLGNAGDFEDEIRYGQADDINRQ